MQVVASVLIVLVVLVSLELGETQGNPCDLSPCGIGGTCVRVESIQDNSTKIGPAQLQHIATQPNAAHPNTTQPSATQTNATQPTATHPNATQPSATQPSATHPNATQPSSTQTNATQPTATHPNATQPSATQPNTTHPNATQPSSTQTNATQPSSTQTNATQTNAAHPSPTQPSPTHPSQEEYYCQCLPCYMGDHCETRIETCTRNCENNGICQLDQSCRETCQCPDCFTGSYCEVEADGCNNNPCRNGGQCHETGDGCLDYNCTCAACYFGKDCRVADDECLRSLTTEAVSHNVPNNNSNVTPSTVLGEKENLREKVSVLTAAIAVLVCVLIVIGCVCLGFLLSMIRKNRTQKRMIKNKDTKITEMAVIRDQMAQKLALLNKRRNMSNGDVTVAARPPELQVVADSEMETAFAVTAETDDMQPITSDIQEYYEEGTENPVMAENESPVMAENIADVVIETEEDAADTDGDGTLESSQRRGPRPKRKELSAFTLYVTDFQKAFSCMSGDD
ncbi:uncharacterized protein [Ptychodera flava]|uniref:uncharacterized protein n=1 Tax=Ptychodera flava TaxID=63121 RepID=UPI00396A8527